MQVELRVHANGSSGKTANPEWLDEDFLQLCMQSGEGDPTIRVMNYKLEVFRHAKDIHSPVMYRVSVEFKRRPRSRNYILDFKPQEIRWLIIKMIPHDDGSPVTNRKSIVFDKEVTALSTTIPSIGKQYGLFQLAAQCFYSEKSPRALVVMEDVSKNDFVPGKMDRVRGLDYDHCTLVLRSMAALHAGSVAVGEKTKISMETDYSSNIFTEEGSSLVQDIIDNVIPDVADEIASWQNFGDKYADRIRAMKSTLADRLGTAVNRNLSGFNVLNHGHCWYNNLMFRYNNATRKVQEVLFVDFQESIFSSPVIDLQHFLYSSPTEEVRLQNYGKLIQFYHKELVSHLDKLKVKTKPPTRDELIKEMDSRGIYSVWVAFTLLPIIFDENVTGTSILRNPNSIKERRKMYSNEQYKVSIKRLLQIFDSKGLLD